MAWYQDERLREFETYYVSEQQARTEGAQAAFYGWTVYQSYWQGSHFFVTYKHFSD